ncbi:cytochrome c [uncultured Limimaricola sp.]|uniref:c-type cytochrome n=1 Tax=uncultured Limimaricola sp. TaxID=2211667 RepID=UPI0030FBC97F
MTRYGTLAIAAVAVMTGAVAVAHNGATGVVRERMEGMVAMRDVMRDLTPMMRGDAAYDAAQVTAGAKAIATHAGDTMTALFPEGSSGGASFAKEAIWSEAETFASLAEELRRHADGLALAAANQTAPTTPDDGVQMAPMAGHEGMDMGGMNTGAPTMDHMAMGETPPVEAGPGRGLSVAQLLGVEPRRPQSALPKVASLQADTPGSVRAAGPDYAVMASNEVFRMIGETCSACHGRYRSGS